MLVSLISACNGEKDDYALRWIEEESKFVDCEITEDNFVILRYSICFVNESEEDLSVSVSARFNKKEIEGWIKYDFLEGLDERGELLYAVVKRGERVNVTYTFKAPYLGGKINESLSFPEDVIIALM